MRADMSKVVTERPRHGSRRAITVKHGGRLSRRDINAARDDVDDINVQDSAPHLRRGCHPTQYKEFSDLLGPLKGYLRKQVGRPWNKVYSEMSQNLDKRTMSGRHIWTHVFQEVELHCYIGSDGKVYPQPRWRWVTEQNRWPAEGLYVHPRTGLLCYRKRTYPWRRRRPEPVTEIKLDDLHKIERLDGIWYMVTLAPYETYVPPVYLHKGKPHERIVRAGYFTTKYAVQSKRQLGTKELRRRGLKNEATA